MSRSRIRQLEAFHAVLQTGSATRAAELLRISQPSVSKLLQDLESDIGVLLFERVRKRLVPTAEARRLGQEVESLFLKLSRFEHVANEIRARGVGKLRIASLPALGVGLIPLALARFRRDQPEIQAVLTLAPSQRVIEMVVSGEADVGFAYPVPGTPTTLVRHTLAVLPAMAAMPLGHRLAHRKGLHPTDLEGEPFISLGREDRSRDNMDALFAKAGVDATVAVETQFAAVVCELVAAGAGVALVDAITAYFYRDRLIIRPIEPSFNFDFGALTPVGPQSSTVHRLIGMIADQISAIVSAQSSSRTRSPKGAQRS